MNAALAATATVADYDRIFETERAVAYPMVDALEQRMGHALDRSRLEGAARVLACPLKANAPNWQHGRVLYALARHYVETVQPSAPVTLLDVGTAKGFSALCLEWSLEDREGDIYSVDVLDPSERVRRNTVAEVDGYKTLSETLAQWPEASAIHFEQSTGIDWLKRHPERIHVAFVDGKHSGDVVVKEGKLLADRQQSGDVTMFDDVQIHGVAQALKSLDCYAFEYLDLAPVDRKYAIGVRR